MPASRIAFALNDALIEIRRLRGQAAAEAVIEVHLDPATFDVTVKELEYHFGAPLKVDPQYHRGRARQFAGARLVPMLPGNRNG